MDTYFTPEGYIEYWESCDPSAAHLWEKAEKPARWYKWLPWFDFKDKIVIDYGCGGAFLYDVIKHKIKKYIGIDIAQRSLIFAKKRLEKEDKCEFHQTPVDLGSFGADIFVCQQVLSHFPYEDMLMKFIDSVRGSGIPQLLLEIIEHPQKYAYEFEKKDIHSSCWIGLKFIEKVLEYEICERDKYDKYSFIKLVKPQPDVRTEKFPRGDFGTIVDQAAQSVIEVEHCAIGELRTIASMARRMIENNDASGTAEV